MALILSGSVDVGGSMTATTIVVSAPGAGGIVSSSQQIQNYNTFAITSSANTFYGNQTITGNINIRSGNSAVFYRPDNGIYTSLYDSGSGAGNGFVLNNTNGEGFHFKNAAVSIMRLDSANNLGLGTITPLAASGYTTISVNNAANGGILDLQQNGTSVARFGNNGTSVAFLETRTATPITISTNDTQRIHITSGGTTQVTGSIVVTGALSGAGGTFSGQFGIGGGTSPGYNLKVTGNTYLSGASSGTSDYALVVQNSSAANLFLVRNDGDVSISTGNIVMGTSGKGIDFSANANASGMTSELLNDYEEGTWTPVIRGSGTAGTYTLTGSTAYYTKIGNQVTIYASAAFSAASGGTGYMEIASLPFTYKANTVAVGQFSSQNFDFSAGTVYPVILPTSSGASTNIFVSEIQDNGASTEGQISGVTTSTSFRFTFTYTV